MSESPQTTDWVGDGVAAVVPDLPLIGHLAVWRDDEGEWRFMIGTEQWLTMSVTMCEAQNAAVAEVRRQLDILGGNYIRV